MSNSKSIGDGDSSGGGYSNRQNTNNMVTPTQPSISENNRSKSLSQTINTHRVMCKFCHRNMLENALPPHLLSCKKKIQLENISKHQHQISSDTSFTSPSIKGVQQSSSNSTNSNTNVIESKKRSHSNPIGAKISSSSPLSSGRDWNGTSADASKNTSKPQASSSLVRTVSPMKFSPYALHGNMMVST